MEYEMTIVIVTAAVGAITLLWFLMKHYMYFTLAPRNERENFFRLSILLIDYGGRILRDVLSRELHKKFPKDFDRNSRNLTAVLGKTQNILCSKYLLNKDQKNKLYPGGQPAKDILLDDLDISLLGIFLRNTTSLSPIATEWSNPSSTETDTISLLSRMRIYRNQHFAHIKELAIDNASFHQLFLKIKAVLLDLSSLYTEQDYLSVLNIPLDSRLLDKHAELTTRWARGQLVPIEKLEEKLMKALADSERRCQTESDILSGELQQSKERQAKLEMRMDTNEIRGRYFEKVFVETAEMLSKESSSRDVNIITNAFIYARGKLLTLKDKVLCQVPVMSPTQKNVLVQMAPMLVENLQIEEILPYMVNSGTMTKQNAERIMKYDTEQDQVFEFLQILPKCGPRAFGNFVHALRMHNMIELADELDQKATGLSSKKQLASFYIQHISQIQRLPWDPNDTMHIDEVYVNLQWIKEDKTPTGASTTPVHDYASIFSNTKEGRQPKRILIKGKAGVGKTTCTQKMAVDWANGKLSAFSHLLVLNLRHVEPKQTLKDAIKLQLTLSRGVQHAVTDEIMRSLHRESNNVLLILDGYDEYDPETSEEITDIIYNRMHQNVCTVITTRPWKAEDLMSRRIIDSFYEITGLTNENIVQYVANFFDDKELYKPHCELKNQRERRKAEKAIGHGLVSYIHQRKLQSLVSIPILLLFICLLWQEERQSGKGTQTLPASYAPLYEKLLELLIRRRYNAQTKKDVDSYTEKLRQTFIDLGKAALDGLLKPDGGLVFDDDDLHSIEYLDELYIIGLLSRSKVHCEGLEVKHATTFPHKTIQEFFAAKYLAHTTEKDDRILEDFLNRFTTHENLLDFQYVLLFACGLSERLTSGILKKATHIAAAETYDAGKRNDILRIERKLVERCNFFNEFLFEHWNACSYENKALPLELQHWRRLLIIPESFEHPDPTFQQVLQDSALNSRPCDFEGVKVICLPSFKGDEAQFDLISQQLHSLSKCEKFTKLIACMFWGSVHCYVLGHVVSKSPKIQTIHGYHGDVISIASIQNPANMRYLKFWVSADISEQDMTKLREMKSLENLKLSRHYSVHIHHSSSLGEIPEISRHLTYLSFCDIPLGATGVQLLGENLHFVPDLTKLELIDVFNDRGDIYRCSTRCECAERTDQRYQHDKCEDVCGAVISLSEGVTHTTKLYFFSFRSNHIGRCHGIISPLISLIQSLSTVSKQTDISIDMSYNDLCCVDDLSELMKTIVSSYQHVAEWDLIMNGFGEKITLLTRGLDKLDTRSVKLRRILIGGKRDEDAEKRLMSELRKHMPR